MGLFDLFKKKKSIEPQQKIASSTYSVNPSTESVRLTVTVSKPKDQKVDLGITEKNGIRYHNYNETRDGATIGYSVPEYNEVYVFYTFLNKYPRIKKPDLLRECDYPHTLFSHVGIDEVSKLHKELHEKGFYQRADNRDALSGYKVGDLKQIIEQLGLSIKGKKEDLIDGLISQADENALASILGDEYYVISTYGKQWMNEHELEYDWYTDEEEFPSFEEFKALRAKKPKIQIQKERYLAEIKKDKESFGRYAYDGLIGILETEGNKREVVVCYLKELLLDMSGALNYADWKSAGFARDIIRCCNHIYFTPHLLKTFPKYKDFYDPAMIEEVFSLKLPVNACNIDDFRDIAEMMFDGTMDEDTRKQYQDKLSRTLVELGISKH